MLLRRELIPGGLDLEAEGLTHGIEQGEVIGVVFLRPGSHRRIHRQRKIWDHPLHRELAQMTDAMAISASTVGAVKREQPRRQFLHHSAMHRTGEVFGVEALLLHPLWQLLIRFGHHLHQCQAVAALEGRAQGIGESFLNALAGDKAINDHFDVVGVVLVELDVVGQLAHFAVDAHPREALGHKA